MNKNELNSIINFVDKSRDKFSNYLSVVDVDSDWKMISYTVRQHLNNKVVTINSLISISGLAFTTGLRRANKLIEKKIFIKRPRTSTGKSFSIHPSEKLIKDFFNFLYSIKSTIASNLGFSELETKSNYYFGMSLSAANIVPPPHILSQDYKKNTVIRILTNTNPTFLVIKNNLQFFENILGVKIQLETLELDKLHDEIFINSKLKRSKYDIIAFNLPWLGELVEEDVLQPLSKFLFSERINLQDFHQAGIEGSTYNYDIFGLPIETIPDLLFYRKDILNKYGLNPPNTTDDLLNTALTIQNQKCELSPISWPAQKGTPLGTSFILALANFGQPIINLKHIHSNNFDTSRLDKNIKPLINTNTAIKAGNYLKKLVQISPNNISSMSWDECAKHYADGNSVMVMSWSSRAHLFELNKNSPAYLNTGYLPLPAAKKDFQLSPIGGFSFGIPKHLDSDQINICLKIIKHLTSPQVIKYYIEQGSLSCPLFSVSNDPEVKRISPIFENIDKMEKDGKIVQWPRVAVPEYSKIVNIIGNELFDGIFLSMNIEEALNNAQIQVKKLFN